MQQSRKLLGRDSQVLSKKPELLPGQAIRLTDCRERKRPHEIVHTGNDWVLVAAFRTADQFDSLQHHALESGLLEYVVAALNVGFRPAITACVLQHSPSV